MALNSLFCADVPLSNYSLTHVLSPVSSKLDLFLELQRQVSTEFHWRRMGWWYILCHCTNHIVKFVWLKKRV